MKTSSQSVAMLGLVGGCVIFGMGSLIVVHVPVGSYAMAFWRLLISSVIFLVLARCFGQALPVHPKAIVFALLSGVALGVDLALWHESIRAVGPGISTLLNSLQIFFLAFIGFVFYQEKQTKFQLISLVLAIVGVALIASPEFKQNIQADWGFVSGILSGAALAISMAWIRQTHRYQTVPILPLMALVGVGGASAIAPVMWLVDAGRILPTAWADMGWLMVYGTVMQCLAWGLIAYNIPKLSLALTGLLLLSEPVAALALDYFWLDKSIIGRQCAGALLTMLAIYLGSVKAKPSLA